MTNTQLTRSALKIADDLFVFAGADNFLSKTMLYKFASFS